MDKQKITKSIGKIVVSTARKIAIIDANTTCAWIGYQPPLPKDAKKLRKF